MWNPFKKKIKEDDWKLVDTVNTTITWKDSDKGENQTDMVYYYLYENYKGKRKVEYQHTDNHRTFRDVCEQVDFYLEKVYPWTQGDDTIQTPSYWDKVKDKNKQCVDEMYKRLLENNS